MPASHNFELPRTRPTSVLNDEKLSLTYKFSRYRLNLFVHSRARCETFFRLFFNSVTCEISGNQDYRKARLHSMQCMDFFLKTYKYEKANTEKFTVLMYKNKHAANISLFVVCFRENSRPQVNTTTKNK